MSSVGRGRRRIVFEEQKNRSARSIQTEPHVPESCVLSTILPYAILRRATLAGVRALLLVGGCANTTVLSSSNPAREAPNDWRDYDRLPIRIVGSIPGRSQAELASLFPAAPAQHADRGRHIVMYVNATQLPAKPDLSGNPDAFQAGGQSGDAARVTGALRDGGRDITRASGDVVTAGQSMRWLVKGFDLIRNQFYQSLYSGTNDSAKWQQN